MGDAGKAVDQADDVIRGLVRNGNNAVVCRVIPVGSKDPLPEQDMEDSEEFGRRRNLLSSAVVKGTHAMEQIPCCQDRFCPILKHDGSRFRHSPQLRFLVHCSSSNLYCVKKTQ